MSEGAVNACANGKALCLEQDSADRRDHGFRQVQDKNPTITSEMVEAVRDLLGI